MTRLSNFKSSHIASLQRFHRYLVEVSPTRQQGFSFLGNDRILIMLEVGPHPKSKKGTVLNIFIGVTATASRLQDSCFSSRQRNFQVERGVI